ncbi:DH domain-containing protein [Gloeophyllum trabeum ATCC 11539]|uniref:DH domain-containing protein n=1 Tax=Gloeophyllum trabeum (strain ATCC 11539 / FP-39264 / Madison 617) TaxID=670483 RepID=S7RLZ2_GLOTA|nr:DH domain-containing protein [Gloeophyllum trabeum ATCC 11539]EPQ55415.1 DH domain-containing protein [Gloeophyllum trabeum ATCC 11539]
MSRDANPSWSSPMTPHDVRRIFGNIVELAELSDTLCDRLEPALGNMLEDGGADSCVGQVFLDLIPSLEPLYKTYISGHQLSLSHYAALTTPTPSPAFRTYLGIVESKASSFTDTRDLRSLLEKPVHRFLRYPALLQAIYEETPDGHRDKENLKKAREELLRALRSVNEGLRRREVVRVVLNTVGSKSHSRKKRTFSGLTTGLKLGFIQSLNQSLPYEREPDPGAVNVGSHSHWYDGAEDVSQYERELQLFAKFIEDFHRVVKTWVASVKDFHMQQLVWSLAFGRMMNFVDSDDNSTELSESFDAFVVVSKSYILPACQIMQASIEVRVLARLDMLSDSMEGPMKLLGAMRTLRPLHHHLLRHPSAASGGRDASALMEASQSYVLLRSQLAAELPGYLALLEKGVRGCVGVFVEHQVTLWEVTTLANWWERWHFTYEIFGKLAVVQEPSHSVRELRIQRM